MALISTAFEARPFANFATYRVTSPPPVEWPMWIAFCSSSAVTTAAGAWPMPPST
jgi:hypothetical protein